MSFTGPADGEPTKVGVAIADVTAGLYAVIGILAALRAREHTVVGFRRGSLFGGNSPFKLEILSLAEKIMILTGILCDNNRKHPVQNKLLEEKNGYGQKTLPNL